MPIKVSSARQVDELIADLASDDGVARDAAIARLTIVGARAVDRLAARSADSGAPPVARAAALRALEGIPDPRSLAAAVAVLPQDDEQIALAAIAVIRGYLSSDDGIRALDALTSVVLERRYRETVREAAMRALDSLDASTRAPLMAALLTDSSPRLRALAQGAALDATDSTTLTNPAGWLESPDGGPLPTDPDAVRHEIVRRGPSIDLPRLHQAIQGIRDREQDSPEGVRRAWLGARAAAHAALAHRGSRLALYDLKEILTRADPPLPLTVLDATAKIGDSSCLEPLADLYARTVLGPAIDTWQRHLSETFQAILAREGVTGRHAVARRIKTRNPAAWVALAGTGGVRAAQ